MEFMKHLKRAVFFVTFLPALVFFIACGGGPSTKDPVKKPPEPPQYVTVPNVVGKTEAAAVSDITSAGLTVGSKTEENHNTVPSGSITRQSPTAGASALKSSPVLLWISKGPDPQYVDVPDVVGMTETAAESAITSRELTVGNTTYEHHNTAPSGSVFKQSPTNGTSALKSSPVRLWISLGPAEPPEPPNTPDDPTFEDTVVDGLVLVNGGTFQMGCVEKQGAICDFHNNEKPVHDVTLSNFYIGKYEITQKQWRDVMGTDILHYCNKALGKVCTPADLVGEGPDYPMYFVNWNDVHEFIAELNNKTGMEYRLPTEAEWEYAARGGDKSRDHIYSGSDNPDDVAWHAEDQTFPVGAKQSNELGIFDMSGNVWEMVEDWYGPYRDFPQTNPTGPASGAERVGGRGGSWGSWEKYMIDGDDNPIQKLDSYTEWIRVSFRAISEYDNRGTPFKGFRLAHSSK